MISIVWSVNDLEASRQRLLLPKKTSQQRLLYTVGHHHPKSPPDTCAKDLSGHLSLANQHIRGQAPSPSGRRNLRRTHWPSAHWWLEQGVVFCTTARYHVHDIIASDSSPDRDGVIQPVSIPLGHRCHLMNLHLQMHCRTWGV